MTFGVHYNLDWYPNQNILLGSADQLIILHLDSNYNFVSRQNLYFGNTNSFLRARWNYDGTRIGVESYDNAGYVWIISVDGNIIEKIPEAWQNHFALSKSDNKIAYYKGHDNKHQFITIYNFDNKQKTIYSIPCMTNITGPTEYFDNKIILHKGYILDLSDSSIINLGLPEFANVIQISPNNNKIVVDEYLGGPGSVRVYNIDGSDEQKLLNYSKVELPQ